MHNDKITASLLLEYYVEDFCDNSWSNFHGAVLSYPEAISWVVAALRNLTRVSLNPNFVGYSDKMRQLLSNSDVLSTLIDLIYPNMNSLTATGVNLRLLRHAHMNWGISTNADYALDLFINLAHENDFRAKMRKLKLHSTAYKIFRTCMPEAR